MSFQGAWDGGTTYDTLDSVSFNGSSYVSLVDSNTGNTPDSSPAEWSLIAQKGADGTNGTDGTDGTDGAEGPQGPAGAQGPAGPAGAQGPIGPQGPQGPEGPAGPAGSGMLFFSKHDYDLSNGGRTVYFSPIHIEESNSENFQVVGFIPAACTMSRLAIQVSTGMEAGVTTTFTLRKGTTVAGLADTALACGVTSVATFCTDTDSIAMNAGDLFSLRLSYNSGSTGGSDVFLTTLNCQ